MSANAASKPAPAPSLAERCEELIEWNGSICNKIVNGECSTSKCLIRGGWDPKSGRKMDPASATCEALETVNALREAAADSAELAGIVETWRGWPRAVSMVEVRRVLDAALVRHAKAGERGGRG